MRCGVIVRPKTMLLCRRIWVGSEERLNIQFNPAALLSLGDAHAFVQALLDIAPKAPGVPKGGPTPSTVSTNTKMAQLDSGPEMVEQMAQRAAITSRSALSPPCRARCLAPCRPGSLQACFPLHVIGLECWVTLC